MKHEGLIADRFDIIQVSDHLCAPCVEEKPRRLGTCIDILELILGRNLINVR